MATYDYGCTKCENVFEVVHGMTETPEVKCPECNAEATKKFGCGGLVFKGSGFYVTDYKKSSSSSSSES